MHLAVEEEGQVESTVSMAGFLAEDVLPWREDIPALLAKDHRHGPALRSLEIRVVLRAVPQDLTDEVTRKFQVCKDRLSSRCLRLFELVQYGAERMISHEYVPALPLLEYVEQARAPLVLQELLRQLGEMLLEEEALRSDFIFTPLDILVGEDGVLRFDTAAALLRGKELSEHVEAEPLASVMLLEQVGARLLAAVRRRFVYRFGVNKIDAGLIAQLMEAISEGSHAGIWQLGMQLTAHFPPRSELVAHTLVSQARSHNERKELKRGWYVLGLIALYSFTLIALVAIFSASKVSPDESEDKDLSSHAIGTLAAE